MARNAVPPGDDVVSPLVKLAPKEERPDVRVMRKNGRVFLSIVTVTKDGRKKTTAIMDADHAGKIGFALAMAANRIKHEAGK